MVRIIIPQTLLDQGAYAQVSKRRVESERLLTTFVAQNRGLFLFRRCSALAVRIWGASVYETRRANDHVWILVKSILKTYI